MTYSTRVRYGLRFLVRLALQKDPHLSMGDIAREEGVSIKYLEQIVGSLKPLGILEALRGAHGGYRLKCDPSSITMDKVFECLGGLSAIAPCYDNDNFCKRVDFCTTKPFWGRLDEHMRCFLCNTTLADVVAMAPEGRADFQLFD